jgi:hypothetical protein
MVMGPERQHKVFEPGSSMWPSTEPYIALPESGRGTWAERHHPLAAV